MLLGLTLGDELVEGDVVGLLDASSSGIDLCVGTKLGSVLPEGDDDGS